MSSTPVCQRHLSCSTHLTDLTTHHSDVHANTESKFLPFYDIQAMKPFGPLQARVEWEASNCEYDYEDDSDLEDEEPSNDNACAAPSSRPIDPHFSDVTPSGIQYGRVMLSNIAFRT